MQEVMHRGGRRRQASRVGAAPAGAITLRNLPPSVAAELRKQAREQGLSLNRLVVTILTERLGGGQRAVREPTEHHDLDALAGSWTRSEASRFDRALSAQRRIDAEMWERQS